MTKIGRSRFKSSLRPPLKERATELPIQLAIYVPSTQGDRKLTQEEYTERVNAVEKEMSSKFGGDTSVKAQGDYVSSDGNLVKENISIVEVSMTNKDYAKNRNAVNRYLTQKRGEWHQETIGYKFEDKFYMYPKFKSDSND